MAAAGGYGNCYGAFSGAFIRNINGSASVEYRRLECYCERSCYNCTNNTIMGENGYSTCLYAFMDELTVAAGINPEDAVFMETS